MPRTGPSSLKDVKTLAQFVRNLREGVYVTSADGDILDANPAFLDMIGVSSLRELRRYHASELVVDQSRRDTEMLILAREGAVREFELQIRRADGEIRTVLDTAYQVKDPVSGETLYHGILVDITDRKQLEQQLREAAIRDPLTGCYNRRYLQEIQPKVEPSDAPWGAIVIDVDNFKRYNDEHGHLVGDQVLIRIARFLAREVRAEDVVIRMGGDEFLILICGPASSATAAIAARLREKGPASAPVSFTLGWAVRESGEGVEATVRRADQQLILIRVESRHGRPTPEEAAPKPS
jgi:diguanylate cyclase (GGDEF)-like protein/PAS domain S-box-containing protein